MNPGKPFITILMPVYNGGRYIREAIESVMTQTYGRFELLIINDGSTDETVNIIHSFKDYRIRLIESKGHGISAALNTGLMAAKDEYIARFDADDICLRDRLEKQVEFMESNPDVIVVGGNAEYIRESGEHLFDFHCAGYTHEEIVRNLYKYCPFIHSSVMFRKENVLQAGGYSIHAHNFEDHLLWIKLVKSGKCCNLSEPLLKIRFNPGSVTIDERWRGKSFRKLKKEIIERGDVTEKEGNELLTIIKKQEKKEIKESSYHALCCKKYLVDNYQPAKARWHIGKAIGINPYRFDNYVLFIASYFPSGWIKWLQRRGPRD
jgi:glycosyltransferase involved in cell wall biosynthesis